jgi:hypothetical protein
VRPTSPVLWELGEGDLPRLPDQGAEHRSRIEGVMVGDSYEVQLVALMRAHKRVTIVMAADAGSVA